VGGLGACRGCGFQAGQGREGAEAAKHDLLVLDISKGCTEDVLLLVAEEVEKRMHRSACLFVQQ
jgi:hypothetical protein